MDKCRIGDRVKGTMLDSGVICGSVEGEITHIDEDGYCVVNGYRCDPNDLAPAEDE